MANLAISAVEPEQQPAKGPGPKGVLVLRVEGEIDLDTVGILRSRLEEVERSGVDRLVLDLGETKYVNSSALAVLVKFAENFRERGGGIALSRVTSRVKLVFEMLGLLVFFKFFDSVDKAKESLASPPPRR
ncbi:MAG TPA: STAS domain-containing protein [Planctomycetota bacterium]|nr:STAS domain-containing protein [Planctomycetota bacterium]